MIDSILKMGGAWHYRLDKLIARSTFGEVWQATWLQTGSQVAVKTINRSRMAAASPGLRPLWEESLRREIQLMDEIDHPHLVRKHRHGEVDGLPVLVLEQLHHSLADELKIRGPRLPLHEALEIVRQVADGLAWLHRHGICHLDLKPENLLFTPPGPCQRLKLADFGMSLDLRQGNGEHHIPGSLGWLAPEQVFPARWEDGHPVYRSSPRTDVHALGLLFYTLLIGEKTAFASGVECTLRRDPQAIRPNATARLPPAGLNTNDRQRLHDPHCRPAHITSTTAAGTWLPYLPAVAPSQNTMINHSAVFGQDLSPPATQNRFAATRADPLRTAVAACAPRPTKRQHNASYSRLLEDLLAADPAARPTDAGQLLDRLALFYMR